MSGQLTQITELSTALGMLHADLDIALSSRPPALTNVTDDVWDSLVTLHRVGEHRQSFDSAFSNGRAFLAARDGLRCRAPVKVEWKGPHRLPGDDVIPADLRIDHVYLVSCKYLSKVMLNAGPARLFERLLVGEERSSVNWFADRAPEAFQALYAAARDESGLDGLPDDVGALSREQQRALRLALNDRTWPESLQRLWSDVCVEVSVASAATWRDRLSSERNRLWMLWRLLRISSATYFVLGADASAQLRFRVDSQWDWMQSYRLRTFEVVPRTTGQPEVAWHAVVHDRHDGTDHRIDGHVEVRWSHGRFVGVPEAKVYLDTPHDRVPGYHRLE